MQCPRTPPLLDVRPRGRNQDKLCVTVLPLASSSGTRKHTAFACWDPDPRVGTPTVGAPGRGSLLDIFSFFSPFDLQGWRVDPTDTPWVSESNLDSGGLAPSAIIFCGCPMSFRNRLGCRWSDSEKQRTKVPCSNAKEASEEKKFNCQLQCVREKITAS